MRCNSKDRGTISRMNRAVSRSSFRHVHYSFIKKRRDFLLLIEKCMDTTYRETRVIMFALFKRAYLKSAIKKKKVINKGYFHRKSLKICSNPKKRKN